MIKTCRETSHSSFSNGSVRWSSGTGWVRSVDKGKASKKKKKRLRAPRGDLPSDSILSLSVTFWSFCCDLNEGFTEQWRKRQGHGVQVIQTAVRNDEWWVDDINGRGGVVSKWSLVNGKYHSGKGRIVSKNRKCQSLLYTTLSFLKMWERDKPLDGWQRW